MNGVKVIQRIARSFQISIVCHNAVGCLHLLKSFCWYNSLSR